MVDDEDTPKPKKPKRTDVGRGKPPTDKQFKPGKSGNPKGRPKGSGRKIDSISKIMSQKIPITQNGRTRMVTIEEAITIKQVMKAIEGDPKAFALVTRAQAAMEKAKREMGPTVEEVLQQREEQAKKEKYAAELSKGMIDWINSEASMKKRGFYGPYGGFSAIAMALTDLNPDREYRMGHRRPGHDDLRAAIGAYLDKYYPDRPERPRQSTPAID